MLADDAPAPRSDSDLEQVGNERDTAHHHQSMDEDAAGGATSTGRYSGNSDGDVLMHEHSAEDGRMHEQSAEDGLTHEQISTDDMSTDGTAAGGPKGEGSSFSDYAYDPLAYVGVCPYPDSRGPLEHDPTPQAKYGREQAQLYSTVGG